MGDRRSFPLAFALLGTLSARRGEEEISLGPPQQRAVLAALLLRRGQSVSVEELVAAVWKDPPAGAISVVRTYISRLRAALEPGRYRSRTAGLLRSTPSGYFLSKDGNSCDLELFERDMQTAERRFSKARYTEARELLKRALEHWSGPPLGGLPGPLAHSERSRLTELRLLCQERALEADMRLGQHQRVVPELIRLTSEHPLRERLRQLLMVALYQGDRQAEALAVYHDARRALVEQLGIEPTPPLQALYGRILAADPELLPSVWARPAAVAAVPAQLPGDLPDFTGRTSESDKLLAGLTAPAGLATPVAAITGMGGVGKSSLAVHVAHRLKEYYPDGQLYADLATPDGDPVPPDLVLKYFLGALGAPAGAIPEDSDRRAASFRSRVSGRRILILLDNASDVGQVRALLPGSSHCTVIVTSRARLGSLPTTVRVPLAPMDIDSAALLFTRIVGCRRTPMEPGHVRTVTHLCGLLPLAVRIVASRHAARPDWTLGDTIEELRDERTRLQELRLDDLTVQGCFDLSYRRLTTLQAWAFRELAAAEQQSITGTDAAAVLGLEPADTLRVLDSLVDVGMLESPSYGHYRYQDVMRVFARHGVPHPAGVGLRVGLPARG
ncbi:BTAD domain-containing putative transcriptional regulator [Streptomyces sp. NPDC102462]|uniref:AfsR/SARP family transcriptional regulator n=1 Tax=Streptomyces sp. NPDC102462 TaxID=3366178 RepID=UPI0037FB393B